MKTFIIYALLAMVALNLISCDLRFDALPPKTVFYNLGFNFQDSSGNDLVNGIGLEEWIPANISMENALSGTVNRELYVLDIAVSDPCTNWDNDIYNSPARPGFIPDVNRPIFTLHNNGDCYLNSSFSLLADACPDQRILIYKLKIAHVFGDDAIYEFVTYWDVPKEYLRDNSKFAKCYRIEFDGNVFIPETSENESRYYSATIVLK
ncbi:hypothetical protein [Alkaliflexus imshenetskii]|uniref:hypothetical protein n=1 Tax=Alkaliflexus imshenetskii TaxID=286730 RepID=UPI000478D1D1|nr:hypothetical protein [Alkaliflexus imshenetskii]